ncbi:TIGR00730 family Rossman fold protein [Marinivivus vitaminiproducens]|uniref:LOG family protein n=1 Tax=Marinivivus vitaminiproducens TaxID=3035935 RepID=UPI0027998567|nr:TIGR00730 family Rossman fold protein [Geminicoccaceae bacterium SCSIO 64248]
MISSVCVFCGSRNGLDPAYRKGVEELARALAKAGLTFVYGGGDIGLMGAGADAAVAAGGIARGIIPDRLLEREVGHRGISELVVTRDMFDRKARMIAESDAFVIMPGGLGTLDELFEVLTLRQLGYHDKPIVVVDLHGYWQPLLAAMEQVVEHGFADASIRELYCTVGSVEEALARLRDGPAASAGRLPDA